MLSGIVIPGCTALRSALDVVVRGAAEWIRRTTSQGEAPLRAVNGLGWAGPVCAALSLFLAAAVSVASGQERQPPEFKTGVALIRLDVSAVDRAGRPVAGLRVEDFRVTEDGRPVELTYFEAVEVAEQGAPAEGVARPGRPPLRRLILMVDTASMSQGQLIRARQSAVRFLHDETHAGDWVRVVNLATSRAWDGRIPEDRFRLELAARALDRSGPLHPDAGPSLEGIEESFDRSSAGGGEGTTESETRGRFLSIFSEASGLLGTLELLLVQLGAVEGRKALVLISPGFPQLGGLDRRIERVTSLAREAATAVYFVDATGLDGLLPEPGASLTPAFESAWERSGGAQDLAEATGGFAARFSNSLVPDLARIGAELRTYYVLGYVPRRAEDGRFHAVKVSVNVDGVQARTKKGYLAAGSR